MVALNYYNMHSCLVSPASIKIDVFQTARSMHSLCGCVGNYVCLVRGGLRPSTVHVTSQDSSVGSMQYIAVGNNIDCLYVYVVGWWSFGQHLLGS